MARIIKKGTMYYGVSRKYNTNGNPLKRGQSPYIITIGKTRRIVAKRLRSKGYSIGL